MHAYVCVSVRCLIRKRGGLCPVATPLAGNRTTFYARTWHPRHVRSPHRFEPHFRLGSRRHFLQMGYIDRVIRVTRINRLPLSSHSPLATHPANRSDSPSYFRGPLSRVCVMSVFFFLFLLRHLPPTLRERITRLGLPTEWNSNGDLSRLRRSPSARRNFVSSRLSLSLSLSFCYLAFYFFDRTITTSLRYSRELQGYNTVDRH